MWALLTFLIPPDTGWSLKFLCKGRVKWVVFYFKNRHVSDMVGGLFGLTFTPGQYVWSFRCVISPTSELEALLKQFFFLCALLSVLWKWRKIYFHVEAKSSITRQSVIQPRLLHDEAYGELTAPRHWATFELERRITQLLLTSLRHLGKIPACCIFYHILWTASFSFL